MKFSHILLGFVFIIFASCNSESSTGNSDTSTTDKTKTNVAEPVGNIGMPDGKYKLTKGAPNLSWFATKINGSSHSGIIPTTKGGFKIENGIITSGSMSLDMNGFEVTDIDGDSKANFDEHLKSEDFLDIKSYPTANIVFNNSTTSTDGTKQLHCTLDMHGVEVDYIIPFTLAKENIENGGYVYKITSKFYMDRTKHDIKYGSGSFFDNLGDRAINDDVLISFVLLAL